jgi:hypothetical protein
MSLTIPRVSIRPQEVRHYNKILRSCMLSRQIYTDAKRRNVIVQRSGSCVYVCFKGCSSLNDFISSVDIRSCRIHGEKVGIHNGFCERHKSLKDEVWYGLLENCMSYNITDVVFTGHSAGGSLAQIGSLFSSELIDEDIQLHCYTYGSPKVGDGCFKDAIEETVKEGNLLRIETLHDVVCLLPMQPGFEHVGKLLLLGSNQSNEISENNQHHQFFQVYHKDYLEFVKELKSYNLMNKQSIIKMIDEHSCDIYSDKIVKMMKELMVKKQKNN